MLFNEFKNVDLEVVSTKESVTTRIMNELHYPKNVWVINYLPKI